MGLVVRNRRHGHLLMHRYPHRLQTPRPNFRIAEFTACGNLVVTGRRVPGEFSPFDGASGDGIQSSRFNSPKAR
jgi:hypothetical protein